MPNNWYDMVYLDNIPVNRYFSQICRHVPGGYQFHFFLNQILPLSHRIWFAPSAFCHSCVCRSFRIESWGHFPTSNFAGQNTEVGTHFLCLLWKFYPLIPTTKECSILPKRAKKKRCNLVKAATLLSVIFSCVRTAYLSEFSISATSFAVAVTILNPLSLILSSRVSSCRRCVDFSASLFGKKNWSTDML